MAEGNQVSIGRAHHQLALSPGLVGRPLHVAGRKRASFAFKVGTFHHVDEQHLQRYVAEFDFRWNTRTKMGYTDAERAQLALKGIAGKRLMYGEVRG